MSEKIKDKRIRVTNVNNKKREKFIKPLITDEDFNNDSDAFFSIVKNRAKNDVKKEYSNRSSFYISPMRGKVEDRSTFPVTSSRGKIGKQYDFLRQDKKSNDKEETKNKYYEFNLLNNEKRREAIRREHMAQKTPVKVEESPKVQPTIPNQVQKKQEEQVMNKSLFEENRINIIYEEEIDIDDSKSIVTSYDENSKVSFFNDFDNVQVNKDVDKYYANVQVYEHKEEPKGLKEELKKLFAEYDDEESNEVYFKEEISPDIKPKVISQPYNTIRNEEPVVDEKPSSQFDFNDLKKELDQELNKKINKTPVKTPPPKKETFELNVLDDYMFPPMELLHESTYFVSDESDWIQDQISRLDSTLQSFGIAAKTVNHTQGPSVTRFEVEPEPGIKVSKITALQDDIKLRLAASDIRIEAPISGKSTVGIEVPNKETRMVRLREILDSTTYKSYKSPLKIALGLDITGEPIYSDISNMTHSLIAGSTGSGKSVCINTIIVSILYNATPDEVKLILIDPKKVEFSLYRDIPHLLTPVINDPKTATATLRWVTEEMDRRYELIESVGARDIKSYNSKRSRSVEDLPKLPYIVVIIDELADLMLIAAQEVEDYIQRISQLARAAGIHLIVATQRPSTNVITGTIKTNIPTRISFKVASAIDSRIILDESGAEKLLGKGDMLLSDNGKPQLNRLQGSFISDEEIEKVTRYIKKQLSPNYLFTGEELVKKENEFMIDYDDELFDDVVRFVIDLGEASASRIQRQFKVGYNRAARIIDMMEKYNIIGPQQSGSKPREVLMSLDEYEELIYS